MYQNQHIYHKFLSVLLEEEIISNVNNDKNKEQE